MALGKSSGTAKTHVNSIISKGWPDGTLATLRTLVSFIEFDGMDADG